ncbi:aspartyl/asparaginyl beta-hydroxylase domain-containing protein [Saccharibacter floricola]|uniref:Aspartyl/asparaginyl beta-hydroxylase n=1 Tax=Saccharibacter floricola DSM 15669 TaxID=1123227 RepID=A0ABQ0NY86_9PROT|nr:aspartyl/asparaginyl beta-hydroxylase domain-containing protein [Saccharibacter floricola]GBQ06056.1 aspartyl/asparaginyl beta-hydroxylase [Saccharibacter floricola DSM 15669]
MSIGKESKKKRPLLVRMGKKLRPLVNWIIARDSCVPNEPFVKKDLFPWGGALEKAYPLIAEEFRALMEARENVPALRELSPDHRRIAPDQRWKSFFLFGYGLKVPENCAKAPVTAQLVGGIPGLCSALFSILEPGGVIPAHYGVTKGMLNCHMGIDVPKDPKDCWIEIAGQRVAWKNGKAFVFDDTYRHHVRNKTDELRCILFIQFERPTRGLGRMMQKIFLSGVRHSAFVQDVKANMKRWNKHLPCQ